MNPEEDEKNKDDEDFIAVSETLADEFDETEKVKRAYVFLILVTVKVHLRGIVTAKPHRF